MSSRFKEIAQEGLTSWAENGKACVGCIFSKGSTPFSDSPDKCSCEIYQYPKTKPDSVYLEGKSCKYRREAVEKALESPERYRGTYTIKI